MALDRKGIARAIRDLLRSDTDVLYGKKKLIQYIEDSSVFFAKSRVNNIRPNALFIWVSDSSPSEERMQNTDYLYTVDLRFESIKVNPEDASNTIDDALERINYLINEEMYTGTVLSDYYTDTSAQVINISPASSIFDYPESTDGKRMIVEIEGAINIEINKWT